MVVALVDDLLFASKIRAAAEAAGQQIRFIRSAGDALPAVEADGVRLVLLDLDRDALQPQQLIEAIRARDALRDVRVAAFVRHTSTDRITAARAAGADVVLARSAFFPALPDLLTGAGA
ncbi:MAG: hypothetical protein R2752_16365 [Vicinamibacterales bacterium]